MDRVIHKEAEVDGPVKKVWDAWTTTEGVVTFFAPAAKVHLRTGGVYELYFMTEAPEGSRGSEGCTILGFDPDRSLAFTWNFPPHLPIRDEKTSVKLLFHDLEGGRTRLELIHSGWREGPAWEQGYAYFDQAWDVVLARLQHRFLHGPVDWNALQSSQESS